MSENNIQVFTNEKFGKVRTVNLNGDPWFVAADVCGILGTANPTIAVKNLEDFERSKLNLGPPQGEVNIINESGLYTMIIRSRKGIAKPFRLWVTSEVLPAIRKNGGYEMSYIYDSSSNDYSTEFLELSQKFDKLYEDMGRMARLIIDIHEKISQENEGEIPESKCAPVSTERVRGFVPEFKEWRNAVYKKVGAIVENGDFTDNKEVLKAIYTKMTNVYGVCWSQELADYRDAFEIPSKVYTLEIIWNKEMLRSIFNGILGGMMQENHVEIVETVDEKSQKKKYGDCDTIIRPLIEKRSDSSNHGCATFKLVYGQMDRLGEVNWEKAETRYINKYGDRGASRKTIIESSPTLMKKFKSSVRVMLAE